MKLLGNFFSFSLVSEVESLISFYFCPSPPSFWYSGRTWRDFQIILRRNFPFRYSRHTLYPFYLLWTLALGARMKKYPFIRFLLLRLSLIFVNMCFCPSLV